ncbi:MAG TPA: hypothetical protein VFB45_15565 [Pseudolabrys sp.]|nr:hypothetical protein [Pseudolabrys sp.]
MRMFLIAGSILGVAALCAPALAQQKTAKACQEEWRANKADNQAKGITEKAYVAQCRGGTAAATPATPAATPAASTTAATPNTPATGGEKTAKACRDEWRANKADNQAKGITEKAYVEQCRGGSSTAAPAAAPAPAPATKTTTAPSAAPAPAPSTTTAAKPAARTATTGSAPSGANQFAAESQAKARCPSDTVVWVNLNSDIYHFAGHKDYGTTKSGAYMCEKDATTSGMRAAKNEKHP